MHVVHLIHNLVPGFVTNNFTLQTPSTGNLLVLQWIGICDISAVSDSNHNNYISTGPPLGNSSGGFSGDLQTFYVGSALTSTSLEGPTITLGNVSACGSSSNALLYDIAGAAASPYDSVAGRATATGQQTVSGPLTTVSITPSTPNGLIITQTGVDAHTLTGVTPGNFLATEPTPDIITGAIDNNNGWALYYNTGTNPITFVYTTKSGAVSAWASIAVAFKSAN